jgi:hypothetical protein
MATTTTNYGWAIPQSTDLVKDGATAIATLGSAIDTSINTALGTKKAGMVLLNTTSFSAVASQSVNSVFNTNYDNYLILLDFVASTSISLSYRLRVGGVDNSSAVYARQYLFANSTTVSAGRATTNTSWPGPANDGSARTAAIIDLFGPFLTRVTGGAGKSLTNYSGTPETVYEEYGHNSATSFDGFTIIPNTGTITGTVSVYGYNK